MYEWNKICKVKEKNDRTLNGIVRPFINPLKIQYIQSFISSLLIVQIHINIWYNTKQDTEGIWAASDTYHGIHLSKGVTTASRLLVGTPVNTRSQILHQMKSDLTLMHKLGRSVSSNKSDILKTFFC